MTTTAQLSAELAPHRMVAAANLMCLVAELIRAGIPPGTAEVVVGKAFQLGAQECERIYKRCLDEAADHAG